MTLLWVYYNFFLCLLYFIANGQQRGNKLHKSHAFEGKQRREFLGHFSLSQLFCLRSWSLSQHSISQLAYLSCRSGDIILFQSFFWFLIYLHRAYNTYSTYLGGRDIINNRKYTVTKMSQHFVWMLVCGVYKDVSFFH